MHIEIKDLIKTGKILKKDINILEKGSISFKYLKHQ
jgi:hypothetical protein